MSAARTNRQIEVFLFRRVEANVQFLVLKRNPEKGGFWQPVTGGVHEGESDIEAAIREVREETGVEAGAGLIDTGYSFTFEKEGMTYYEYVFGLEINQQTNITLSSEHVNLDWVSRQEALDSYLVWPENKKGLEILSSML